MQDNLKPNKKNKQGHPDYRSNINEIMYYLVQWKTSFTV